MINRVGQTLGNYKLVELLGTGGFADVYKGEHIHLGTLSAIKVLKTSVAQDEVEEFRNEARIIAKLEHSNIIRVKEFGIERGTPFLVMDYAPKGSLRSTFPRGRSLPYVSVISYIKQVASALQYAHDQKKPVIHRDIKPENMLILNDDSIVLSDFGIAVVAQSGPQDPVGTPLYMAPEQINGRPVPASDQYSLGIVAYEWLGGELPFRGTREEVLSQQISAPPPSFNGKVFPEIEQVIFRALSKDPQQRFLTVHEFADVLEQTYLRLSKEAQSTTDPVSLVRPTLSLSTAFFNSTTTLIPNPGVQPKASAEEVISRYDGLLQEFHRLGENHEHMLLNISKQDKEQREQLEANIRRERENINERVNIVREIVQETQDHLRTNGWEKVITKKSSLPVQTIHVPTDLAQMAEQQSAVLEEKEKIISLVNAYNTRRKVYPWILGITLCTALVVLLSYAIYWLLTLLMQIFGVHWPLLSNVVVINFIGVVAFLFFLTCIIWLYDNISTSSSLFKDYVLFEQASDVIEMAGRDQNQVLENLKSSRLMQNRKARSKAVQDKEVDLQHKLAPFLPVIARYEKEDGLLIAGWDDLKWNNWQPRQQAMPLIRLGLIARSSYLPFLPALILYPDTKNFIIKTRGQIKENAIQAINSIMLHLLTTQLPGKLCFTLIDPTSMGNNLARFLPLHSYDKHLISGTKVWTSKEDITKQLSELSDHMENVIQQYLHGRYATIDEYNKVAGEIAEPYRIVVIIGFPSNFSKESVNQLMKIATTGYRCGVHLLMTIDEDQLVPSGLTVKELNRIVTELEHVANVIYWNGQSFIWQRQDVGDCVLELDTPPQRAMFDHLLQQIGEKAQEAQQRVEIPFKWVEDRFIIPQYRWWVRDQSTREEIVVPLGRMGATGCQYLRLGKTAHHALIVGETGSGKTNLLHVLIVGLSLIYHPDELEFYLVDFKAVGFTPFARYKLPHARVIVIQSERETGLSILNRLEEELEQRKKLFSRAGVQNIAAFRNVRPQIRMPRVLLVIDECQYLFKQQDDIAKKAAGHLDNIVRTGQSFGIHVVLASQTLASESPRRHFNDGSTFLSSSTSSQMRVRVAMRNDKDASNLILSKDNSLSNILFQFRQGEAIYNADSGTEGGNRRFQTFWFSKDELNVYLDAIRQLSQRHSYIPARTQIIFDGSKNADVQENQLLNTLLHTPTWSDRQLDTIWFGNPILLKDTTHIHFYPHPGNNLLIMCEDENTALGLSTISLFTLVAQHRPGSAHFYIIDARPDTPFTEHLRRCEKQLPHMIKVAHYRIFSSLLTAICDEIENRSEANTEQQPPSIYLLIYGLQHINSLRATDRTLMNQMSTILFTGPAHGVHTLIYCDVLRNFNNSVGSSMLTEFGSRIAFQMSEKDSSTLIGTTEANKLVSNSLISEDDTAMLADSTAVNKFNSDRAILFKERDGIREKFIPYELPSREWLVQTTELLRQKK